MKVRPRNPAHIGALLSYLRSHGCIAYYEAEENAIETVLPHLFGDAEKERLRALLSRWTEQNEGGEVEEVSA